MNAFLYSRSCVAHTLKEGKSRQQVRQLAGEVAARHKGATIISPIPTMHLTLLGGLIRLIHARKNAQSNLGDLIDRFERYIEEEVGTEPVNVWVHEKTPLIAVGRSSDKLALRIQPDYNLLTRHSALNKFMSMHVGSWDQPPFNPHITLGLMAGNALSLLRKAPNQLIRNSDDLPECLAMNGIKLYRGTIR